MTKTKQTPRAGSIKISRTGSKPAAATKTKQLPAVSKPKSKVAVETKPKTKKTNRLQLVTKAQRDVTKIASQFGVPSKEVVSLLETGDIDKAVGFFQKKMLAAIIRLIPIAEKQYKRNPTQSFAYSMNALISQARELAQDLQATGDRQQLAMTLINEVLRPAFMTLAQTIVQEHFALKQNLEDKTKPAEVRRMKELVEQTGRTVAKTASELFQSSSVRIQEMISK